MSGVAGAKNSYQTGVLIGNWNEDTWGSNLVHTLAHADVRTGVSETREHYTGASAPPARPAVRGFDALDSRLVMAHGTNIVDKPDTTGTYVTVAASTHTHTYGGTPVTAALAGKIPAPHALSRTDAIRRKQLQVSCNGCWQLIEIRCSWCGKRGIVQQAAGVDSWAAAADVPYIPMTVTPKPVAGAAAVAPPPPVSAYTSVAHSALESSAVLRETVDSSSIGTDKPHGRSMAFTRSFDRGISGLRH